MTRPHPSYALRRDAASGFRFTFQRTEGRVPAARFRVRVMHRMALPPFGGRRECSGARPHPQSSWAERKMPTSRQAGRNRPALPAQWLYGLLRALPGVPGLLATIVFRLEIGRLDPSIGGSGPDRLTGRD